MSATAKDFISRLKKGDDVFVVVPNPEVRRVIANPYGVNAPCSPMRGRVVSKGKRWLSIRIGELKAIKFDVETGLEATELAYKATIWESEALWKAHVERFKAWQELRKYMQDHREPPDVSSLSDIKAVSLALGFDKGKS